MRRNLEFVEFDVLLNKTLVDIKVNSDRQEIEFKTDDGTTYLMYHRQDCCEHVGIEEIVGNLEHMLNTPIRLAEEVSEAGNANDWGTSTWTFYKLGTINGFVTLRWLGESNGYYSESVELYKVTREGEGKN